MIKRTILAVALIAVAAVAVFNVPNIHRSWLRNKVATRVYEIRGVVDGGGGTGFAIEAPSGVSYVVTNSHVCEYAQSVSEDKNTVLVIVGKHAARRRVLEVSGISDLCLIEGMPGVDGLKLGHMANVGDEVYSVGHPLLGPTTMIKGEVTAFNDATLLHHIMNGKDKMLNQLMNASGASCDLPKEEIREMDMMLFGLIPIHLKVCLVHEKQAYTTSLPIFPGNSGSPVVSALGRVVGVMFASNNETHWGSAVNYWNLKYFLKDY